MPFPAFTKLPMPASVPLNVVEYKLLVPIVKATADPLLFFNSSEPLPDNPTNVYAE
jgi:hypothetical protein